MTDLIAGLERGLLDLLVVDEGAVGAADVDQHIVAVRRGETRHGGATPRYRAGESGWRHPGRR